MHPAKLWRGCRPGKEQPECSVLTKRAVIRMLETCGNKDGINILSVSSCYLLLG